MRIHPEGYRTLTLTFFMALAVALAAWSIIPLAWFNSIASLGLLVFWLFLLRFFRYPDRQDELEPEQILSPADGLVVLSEDLEYCEVLDRKCKKIAIFMSAWDVHINWIPVSGEVTFHRYYPGKHLLAKHPKSSELNERSIHVIRAVNGHEVLIKQIAGIMARRVVTRVKAGDQVEQGNEFGFIKMGSRVELYLPTDCEILVRPGQKVSGRITALAKWPL